MIKITDKFIEELKFKTNIVDIVSQYAQLKKTGGQYWARCPLPGHGERTPSFAVNEQGQYYKCFGCGKGGDVIKFITEVENLDFVDAVKFLAEKTGLKLPEDDGQKYEKHDKADKVDRERLENLLNDAAVFYFNNLYNDKAKEHIEYIKKRRISAQTAKLFRIGVSLDYESLPNFLRQKGYTYEEMEQAGVCYKSEKNGRYLDSQATRLIIPIINNFDKVIAFGGRLLQKTDKGKYKNTKDTKLFIKNKVLFNINNLKKLKTKDGQIDNVIIVEGYMDTISVYSAGIQNVVASMGTSLTVQQAKTLKRYTDKVTICYDGDSAGQKGAIRGLEILKAEGIDVRIAYIPDNMDPDDVINKYGAQGFNDIIGQAKPLIQYKLSLIENKYGEQSATADKLKMISNCLKVIKQCDSSAEQEEYLKWLRDKTNITYESLKRDLEKIDSFGETTTESVTPMKIKDDSSNVVQAQRFIILSVLLKKSYASDVNLQDLVIADKTLNKLVDLICDKGIGIADLGGYFVDQETDEIDKLMHSGDNVLDTKIEKSYFDGCIKTLKIDEIEKEIDSLNQSFSAETDISVRSVLIKHIQEKTLQLVRIKNGG